MAGPEGSKDQQGGGGLEPSPSLRDWINSSETSGDRYAAHFVGPSPSGGGSAERGNRGGSADRPSVDTPTSAAQLYVKEFTDSLAAQKERAPAAEPAAPAALAEVAEEEEEEEDVEAAGGEAAAPDPYLIPKAREAALERHKKTVSAVAVDRSGSRVLTGANDGKVHMYDFEGMKGDMKAFRKVEVSEGNHQVSSLSWSPSSDCFLAVTTSAQAKVFDRDGRELGECVRGDMYLNDVRKTKGHTAGLTGGQWHPTDREQAATCSEDGTVRIWDVNNMVQKLVLKPQLGKASRVAASTCAFSPSGALLAAGMVDGTIQVWSAPSGAKAGQTGKPAANLPAWKLKVMEKQRWAWTARPGQQARGAHEAETEITSLCFARDGKTLVSRAADETLKVWDLRSFKKPVKVFEDLPCNYATTGCAISPDQQLILTGVSCDRAGEGGGIAFYDLSSLEFVRRIPFQRSVTAVAWHERLNQIFAGTGDKSFGEARILYDPEVSTRGALVCAGRAVRSADPLGLNAKQQIYAPNALPMYQETWSKKRSREKDLKDPVKTKRPDSGEHLVGRGRGGKLGLSQQGILTQHLLKTQGVLHREWEDPRQALLKYAEGEEDSVYREAYADTQPKPIFAEVDEEEEEGQKARKVDPGTGMYLDEE